MGYYRNYYNDNQETFEAILDETQESLQGFPKRISFLEKIRKLLLT